MRHLPNDPRRRRHGRAPWPLSDLLARHRVGARRPGAPGSPSPTRRASAPFKPRSPAVRSRASRSIPHARSIEVTLRTTTRRIRGRLPDQRGPGRPLRPSDPPMTKRRSRPPSLARDGPEHYHHPDRLPTAPCDARPDRHVAVGQGLFGRRAPHPEAGQGISFSDVAGVGEAVQELSG